MSLAQAHWKTLKKMVEARGGVFHDKDQAIAFLSESEASVVTEPVTAVELMLDRSMPFGTICGEVAECPTARYVQHGRMFDGTGKQVG